MRYSIFLIFLAFSTINLNAQDTETRPIQNFTNPSGTIRATGNVEIEGSPFYNENWLKGYVLFNEEQRSEITDLKYNNHSNEVHFKKNGGVLALVPNSFDGFILLDDDEQLLFKKGFNSSKHDIQSGSILEVIYSGSVKLLTRHNKNLRKGNRPDHLTGIITHRFTDSKDHFLVDTKGNFHNIKLDEDDILEALGNYKEKLKQFAESNDYDFDEKEDLSKILFHYDRMTSSSDKSN